jgi:hypothetical protein
MTHPTNRVSSLKHRAHRLVSCLVVIAAALCARADEPTDIALKLIGIDGKPVPLTVKEFRALPRVSVEVPNRQGQMERFTGVPVHQLLAKAKVPQGAELRDEWMRAFVEVEAADEYRVVFSLQEIDPGFTDRVVLLADERDGKPLDKDQGPFQMIVPGEKRRARWVRSVESIRVLDSLWAREAKTP